MSENSGNAIDTGTLADDALQIRAGLSVNGTGTGGKSGTELTQRRSRAVRKKKQKDTPAVRNLIVLRAALGGRTVKGVACSTLVEQIENWQIAKATGNEFQMSRLRMMMPRPMALISGQTVA